MQTSRKRFTPILTALLFTLPVLSAIEFSPASIELGRVDENTVTDSVFFVRNTGGHEVTLRRVKPTCGCTKASAAQNEIAAGDSTAVRFSFSSLGFSGTVSKHIIVSYGENGKTARERFTYGATVTNALVLTPHRHRFIGLEAGVTLTIENLTDDTLRITGVDYPERHVVSTTAAKLVGTAVPPRATVKLPLTVRFHPSVKNVRYTWVRLFTDAKITPELRHFLFPLRIPPWAIAAGVLAGLGVATLVVMLLRKRRTCRGPRREGGAEGDRAVPG
jgi:hypothetical protein